ncbi:hypothetical protein KR032_007180, partial [Drosophila birchii]
SLASRLSPTAALLVLACSVSAAPVAESEIDASPEFPASRQAVQEKEEEAEQVHNSSADTSEENDDEDDDEEEAHKAAEESKEDDDDEDDENDDDDDDSLIRRRRDAETTEEPAEETATETPTEDQKGDTTTTTAAAPVRKPVLVLIRDALKKVTTDLPTAQVANNALQYFQQFEHFIQQAIEEVIGDDDDEEESPVTIIPQTEAETATESIAEEIKKPEGEESPEVAAPLEVPEKMTQSMEPVNAMESTSSTSAPLSNAV